MQLLGYHTQAVHTDRTAADNPVGQQAEHVKRPIVRMTGQSMEEDKFKHFFYLLDQF